MYSPERQDWIGSSPELTTGLPIGTRWRYGCRLLRVLPAIWNAVKNAGGTDAPSELAVADKTPCRSRLIQALTETSSLPMTLGPQLKAAPVTLSKRSMHELREAEP